MSDLSSFLPNLFIVGAARSGTTTLHDLLSQHPDIYVGPIKEPRYFTRSDRDLDAYRKLFNDGRNHRYRLDSSTDYMTSPEAIQQIDESVEDPRFIFILRNPIDRARSHYWWARGWHGAEPMEFRGAFRWSEDRQGTPSVETPVNRRYYETGLYSKWLSLFFDRFGRDRVLTIEFSDLVGAPHDVVARVCAYLNIPPLEIVNVTHLNASQIARLPSAISSYRRFTQALGTPMLRVLPAFVLNPLRRLRLSVDRLLLNLLGGDDPPELSAADRAWLADFYREDVAQLRQLTAISFESWADDFPM